MRGHDDARAPLHQAARPSGELVLARAVHATGGLVQGDEARHPLVLTTARHHQRQRQALALAAGQVARVRLSSPLEPHPGESPATRLAGQLVGYPLADQQVAGALGQKRAATVRRDPSPGRCHKPRRRPQKRGLAGAVAAHQRDPLTRVEH